MSGSDDARGGNRRGADTGRGGPAGKKGSAGRGFGGPRRDRDGGGRPNNERGRPNRGADKFAGKDRDGGHHGGTHRQRQFGQGRGEESWGKPGEGDNKRGGRGGQGGDRGGFRRNSKPDERRGGGNRDRSDRREGPREDRRGGGSHWEDRRNSPGPRRQDRQDDRPRKQDDRPRAQDGRAPKQGDRPRKFDRDDRGGKPRFEDRRGRPDDRKRDDRPRTDRQRDDRGGKGGYSRDDRRDGARRGDDRGPQRSSGRPEGRRDADRGKDKRDRFDRDKPRRSDQGRPQAAAARQHEQPAVDEATKAPQIDEPELPEDVDISELHGEIRREMRSLPKGLADKVALHLVAAGKLMDTEPERALEHARYARRRASRIGAVREANGLTAYQMGEWSEALSELRASRRMFGGPGQVAIMADCERALGRPERALELSRSPEAAELAGQESVELRIVAAGARRDLGEIEASVVNLQIPELDPQRQEPWSARLFYAYADNLLAADRVQEAFTWFVHAAHADDEGETDAPERLDELVVVLGGADAAEELVAEAEAVGPLSVIDVEEAADSEGDGAQ